MSLELSALQLGQDKAECDCDTLRLIPSQSEINNEQTRGLPSWTHDELRQEVSKSSMTCSLLSEAEGMYLSVENKILIFQLSLYQQHSGIV